MDVGQRKFRPKLANWTLLKLGVPPLNITKVIFCLLGPSNGEIIEVFEAGRCEWAEM
jgi:hypothetical protein